MNAPRSLLLCLALVPTASTAQGPTLDAATQQEVVQRTAELVEAHYVFPDRAREVADVLRANAAAGKYRALDRPDPFLEAVNRDMQEAAADLHLRVMFNPRVVAQLRQEEAGAQEPSPEFVRMLRENNYRLRKAESLAGNVGYLKLDNFVELRYVRPALVGAMDLLHDSSAFILDLTDNGGGASEASDLLTSWFLPAGTRTGTKWTRATNETTECVVPADPDVRPMLDVPVYILVGARTASAAEAVAYTLQQAGRAKVVGSRTKGMANPGVQLPINDVLYLVVPTSVQRNAVSGTNWEGEGVKPDIAAGPGQELAAAMAAALTELAGRKDDPAARFALLFAAEPYRAAGAPESPPEGLLDACVGEYEDGMRIERGDCALRFRKGDVDRKLTYLADLTFAVEGRTDYRLRFPLDHGRVPHAQVLWFDDTTDTVPKTR